MKPTTKTEAYKPETTDLRDIGRASDCCLTVVTLYLDWETKLRWLVLGESRLRTQRDRPDGRWRLEALLKAGVTDFEHDSAYALGLPLIGVHFDGIEYHQTKLTAWIDPNEANGFHVPKPGYNPMTHPEAHVCNDKHCKRDDPKRAHHRAGGALCAPVRAGPLPSGPRQAGRDPDQPGPQS